MSKKTRNIIILILCYFISLFLFEVIIGDKNCMRIMQNCEQKGFNTPFPYFTSYMIAGINHFILVTGIAIVVTFIKKIDKAYKITFYTFPAITFIFTYPMMIPAMLFAKAFHLYGF